MAISPVQQNSANQAFAKAFTSASAVGNLIIAEVYPTSVSNSTGVTDNASNTYTLAKRSAVTATVEIWYAVNTTNTTLTITAANTGAAAGIIISEFSGNSSTPLDTSSSNSTTGSVPTSGTLTSTGAGVIVGAAVTGSDASWTLGSGYTTLGSVSSSFSMFHGYGEYQVTSAAGPYATSWNTGGGQSEAYDAVAVSFLAKATPPPTTSGANYLMPHHIVVGDGMSRSEVAN